MYANWIGFFYGVVKFMPNIFLLVFLCVKDSNNICVGGIEKELLNVVDVCLFVCLKRFALFLFHLFLLPFHFYASIAQDHTKKTKPECNDVNSFWEEEHSMEKKEVMHKNNNCSFYLKKFHKNILNIKFKMPNTKKKIYLRTGNGKKLMKH